MIILSTLDEKYMMNFDEKQHFLEKNCFIALHDSAFKLFLTPNEALKIEIRLIVLYG
jgi:hypothetical protein